METAERVDHVKRKHGKKMMGWKRQPVFVCKVKMHLRSNEGSLRVLRPKRVL